MAKYAIQSLSSEREMKHARKLEKNDAIEADSQQLKSVLSRILANQLALHL